ncbi:MAG: exonuclease SbcCD subunit D [Ruminococcus sp.]|jgi:exonuclease SbcD
MRFFHLSDLHIGRYLHGYSLIDLQRQVLNQIIRWADREKPDAIVIAGDIYDKPSPSGEAVLLFDWFLTELSRMKPQIPVLIISGNHDSSMRLKYASALLKEHRIYVAARPPRTAEDYLQKLTLSDEYGDVTFYMLPYIRPQAVRQVLGEERMESYHDTVRLLLERETPDWEQRNVLISHQFYTAGTLPLQRSDSETIQVGGLDNVDIEVIRRFDYAALGHIHGAQQVGEPYIRYCGSPMKYSVSEWKQKKGILLVTLGEKGEGIQYETLPLKPDRDVTKRQGTLEEVLAAGKSDDFISVTLTDEKELYRPRDILEEYFPNLLEVKIENSRTRRMLHQGEEILWEEDPMTAFRQFFQEMQGRDMTEEERKVMCDVIKEAGEGEI